MEKEEMIKDYIAVQTLTNITLLSFDRVLYFQYAPMQHGWLLKLTTGECYKLRTKTTSKMILEISPDFVQVNQNYIINLAYLESVQNKTLKCLFFPPHAAVTVSMSQRYYASLKDMLKFI